MENKRKNIYIIIFVTTTIIASCAAVFFGISAANNSNNKTATVDQNLSNQTNNNTTQTQVQIKEVEKGIFVPFDNTQCKNSSEGTTYNIDYGNYLNIHADIQNGNVYLYSTRDDAYYNELGLTVNIPKLSENFNIEQGKVTGFSKKVVDVLIAQVGIGFNYPLIIFLMEDGTVEYMKTEYLKTGNLQSAGKIPELANIVRIEQGTIAGQYDGGYTAIAIDEDGYFYDIHDYINTEDSKDAVG